MYLYIIVYMYTQLHLRAMQKSAYVNYLNKCSVILLITYGKQFRILLIDCHRSATAQLRWCNMVDTANLTKTQEIVEALMLAGSRFRRPIMSDAAWPQSPISPQRIDFRLSGWWRVACQLRAASDWISPEEAHSPWTQRVSGPSSWSQTEHHCPYY